MRGFHFHSGFEFVIVNVDAINFFHVAINPVRVAISAVVKDFVFVIDVREAISLLAISSSTT